MTFKLKEIQDFSALNDHQMQFFDLSDKKTFDQTLVWFKALTKAIIEPNDQLLIMVLESEESREPNLIAPMLLKQSKWFGLRKDMLVSLSNYYTTLYEPLVFDNQTGQYSYHFAKQLMEKYPEIAMFDFNPLNPNSEVIRGLAQGFVDSGSFVNRYFRFGNWYLEIKNKNFEEYIASLPSRLRSTLQRKRRRLERVYRVEIKIIDSEEGLENALNDYEEIYEKSWKPIEPYKNFIRHVVRDFSANGWVKIGLIYLDGKPAAAQIWFFYNNTASIFKLAYAPEFSDYSVGSILMMELIRYSIEVENSDCIDFLSGDEPYKRDWLFERRERWGIRVYRKDKLVNYPHIFKNLVRSMVWDRGSWYR